MLDVCEWSEAIWGFVSWGGDGPEAWRHDAQSRGFSLSGMQEVGAPQTRMVSSQDASAVPGPLAECRRPVRPTSNLAAQNPPRRFPKIRYYEMYRQQVATSTKYPTQTHRSAENPGRAGRVKSSDIRGQNTPSGPTRKPRLTTWRLVAPRGGKVRAAWLED